MVLSIICALTTALTTSPVTVAFPHSVLALGLPCSSLSKSSSHLPQGLCICFSFCLGNPSSCSEGQGLLLEEKLRGLKARSDLAIHRHNIKWIWGLSQLSLSLKTLRSSSCQLSHTKQWWRTSHSLPPKEISTVGFHKPSALHTLFP